MQKNDDSFEYDAWVQEQWEREKRRRDLQKIEQGLWYRVGEED